MASVEVSLNNKKFIVPKNITILEACEMAGFEIPTLCRDKERERPFTSCFICLAQVEGQPRFVPACGTSVRDGMRVTVSGGPIDKARKLGLELILSDHNADCKPPCHKACPAHADVQAYVNAIANGQYKTSITILKKRIPLPATLGRVCPHPCETDCRRNFVDAPVSIRNLKRFIADWDLEVGPHMPDVSPDTGKKVAVVGGGPAGITAAFYLRQNGHAVTIYEQMPALGGMLRYGIPEYRMPKAILDKEIQSILDLGIDVELNKRIGKDFTLKELEQNYDAVFLGLGAWKSKGLRVDGEDHPQVLGGIDFLREVVLGTQPPIGKKVLVIGGGNTAIDAARTAKRLGSDVTVVYRRTEEEMPAEDEEIHDAKQENVNFLFLVGPLGFKFEGDKLTGLECTEMCLGEPDESGRRRPVPKMECGELCLDADTIIKGIGQDVEPGVLDDTGLDLSKWNTVNVKKPVFQTNRPKVFAGGDLVTGPQLVVDALYSARKAAEAIDLYLAGKPFPKTIDYVSTRDSIDEEYFKDEPRKDRYEPDFMDATVRSGNFEECDLGLGEERSQAEAARCMSCGCQDIYECKLKDYMNEYQAEPDRFKGDNHDWPIDMSHPHILREPNKCVKCGKCVDICDQSRGISVYGFVNRGFDSIIAPALEGPLGQSNCISCGDCVAVCPVGAITEKIPMPTPGPFPTVKTATTCARCSLGCQIIVHTVDDTLYKITPNENGWNGVHMCKIGRFDYSMANDPIRLRTPLVKKDSLVETTWEEAFKTASENLKEHPTIVLRPNCTNEEAFLARKIAKELGGAIYMVVDDHDTCDGLNRVLGNAGSNITMEELADHGIVFLYNTDIINEHSVAGVKIRQAAAEDIPVVVVGNKPHNIPDAMTILSDGIDNGEGLKLLDALLACAIREQIITDVSYNLIPHSEQDIINELAVLSKSAIEEKIDVPYDELADTAQTLADEEAILVFGHISMEEARRLALFKLLTKANLLVLKSGVNSQGIADLDIPRITINEMMDMSCDNMLVLGDLPLGFKRHAGCKFLAVQNVVDRFEEADMVFPRSITEENHGTVLTTDRRFASIEPALPTNMENWKLLVELAKAMGITMDYTSSKDVTKELYPELRINRSEVKLR